MLTSIAQIACSNGSEEVCGHGSRGEERDLQRVKTSPVEVAWKRQTWNQDEVQLK